MKAKIQLIRIDNRLVHGQVGVTWVNALDIDTLVVVDDETVMNVFSQKMMRSIAKSSNVTIRFYSVVDFMNVLRTHESKQILFVVIRTIQTLYQMYDLGLDAQVVNIGNIHYEKGRIPYTKKMYITIQDAKQINDLLFAGFKLYYQDVPGSMEEAISKIDLARFEKVKK